MKTLPKLTKAEETTLARSFEAGMSNDRIADSMALVSYHHDWWTGGRVQQYLTERNWRRHKNEGKPQKRARPQSMRQPEGTAEITKALYQRQHRLSKKRQGMHPVELREQERRDAVIRGDKPPGIKLATSRRVTVYESNPFGTAPGVSYRRLA